MPQAKFCSPVCDTRWRSNIHRWVKPLSQSLHMIFSECSVYFDGVIVAGCDTLGAEVAAAIWLELAVAIWLDDATYDGTLCDT